MERPNRNELLWVGSEIKAWSRWGIASKAAKLLERFFFWFPEGQELLDKGIFESVSPDLH